MLGPDSLKFSFNNKIRSNHNISLFYPCRFLSIKKNKKCTLELVNTIPSDHQDCTLDSQSSFSEVEVLLLNETQREFYQKKYCNVLVAYADLKIEQKAISEG